MDFNFVSLRKEGRLAVVTLTDPPANTLTYDMVCQLDSLYQELLCDPDVEGMMITGGGDRFFSGGVNIGMLCSASHHYNINFVLYASEIFERIANGPIDVTAAINGHVTGGGLELALIAHRRYAIEGVYNMGFPEVRLGVIPGLGGTQRLKKLVGTQVAFEMITNGEFISPAEARGLGIVEAILPPDGFKDRVAELSRAKLEETHAARAVSGRVAGWRSGGIDTQRVAQYRRHDSVGIVNLVAGWNERPLMDVLYGIDQAILAARLDEDISTLLISADEPAAGINLLDSPDETEWDYAVYVARRLENFPKICSCLWEGELGAIGLEFALACDNRFLLGDGPDVVVDVGSRNSPERLARFGLDAQPGRRTIPNPDDRHRFAIRVAAGEAVEAACEWLERYAPPRSASVSVGYAKLAIIKGQDMSVHAGMQLEQRLQERLFKSEDGREGMKAYLEKRTAKFTGN